MLLYTLGDSASSFKLSKRSESHWSTKSLSRSGCQSLCADTQQSAGVPSSRLRLPSESHLHYRGMLSAKRKGASMPTNKVGKVTGLNKTTDVTMKRGAVGSIAARDVAEKKLPGKKAPPTLILKRGKNESAKAASSPTRHKK